jgi:acyl-CoA reductase-like NAD-dependent aldehyde dehydrogenase
MQADVWMGSRRKVAESYTDRLSPYDARVVSRVAQCSAEDAKEALKLAEQAAKHAKKVPLHQRCAWLGDVASKLREQREAFAQVLCDEVGKPIAYARIEVDRCIETITLAAETMRTCTGRRSTPTR